jgi:signal peptidase I
MTDTVAAPGPAAKRRRTGRIVFWALFAAAAACLVVAFFWGKQTSGWFSVPSSSMEPTVQPGDDVAAGLGSAVRRGDIIILRLPSGFSAKISTGGDYVRRVIGLPGDRVACCDGDGRVTVDGKPLNETYLYPGDRPSVEPFSVTQRWRCWPLRSSASFARSSAGGADAAFAMPARPRKAPPFVRTNPAFDLGLRGV